MNEMKHWKSISATLLAASLVTATTGQAWANETEKVDSTTFETVDLQEALENVKDETTTVEDIEVITSIIPVGYIANNITALSLNLEKISNPRAKEALQKNIERAIARWEAKNKVEEEPEVETPEEDEVVVTPEEEEVTPTPEEGVTSTPEEEVTPTPETEEEPVVVSEEDEEKTEAKKAAKKAEHLAKAAEKKAAGLAKAEAKKAEAAAKKEAKKVEKEERKANKEVKKVEKEERKAIKKEKHENKGKKDKE